MRAGVVSLHAKENQARIPCVPCIYTTTLEPILAKVSDFDERLRAPPKAGLRLKQNFLYNSFLRATDFFF